MTQKANEKKLPDPTQLLELQLEVQQYKSRIDTQAAQIESVKNRLEHELALRSQLQQQLDDQSLQIDSKDRKLREAESKVEELLDVNQNLLHITNEMQVKLDEKEQRILHRSY
jgi:hypothetical protein